MTHAIAYLLPIYKLAKRLGQKTHRWVTIGAPKPITPADGDRVRASNACASLAKTACGPGLSLAVIEKILELWVVLRTTLTKSEANMDTYMMMTRLSPDALTKPETVEKLNREVEKRIRTECPGVKWVANYAVLGPCDYIDIFEAPSSDAATKVSLLVRSFGHATTETWIVTSWSRFLELAKTMKA